MQLYLGLILFNSRFGARFLIFVVVYFFELAKTDFISAESVLHEMQMYTILIADH